MEKPRHSQVLLIENWGLGDAVMMTAAVQALRHAGYGVTVLAKQATEALLQPSYPDCRYLCFTWPWTAFHGKYRLWNWPWRKQYRLVQELRQQRFDLTLSVRSDPRDHAIMWLSGARQRIGIPRCGSRILVTTSAPAGTHEHRVDTWMRLVRQAVPEAEAFAPRLDVSAYPGTCKLSDLDQALPWIIFHAGAGQPVRRLPAAVLDTLIQRIKTRFRCRIGVVPDGDGYGAAVAQSADLLLDRLSLGDMIRTLGAAAALVANDSGPGHIAAALGIPVCSFFGPQDPAVFRPYGRGHCVIDAACCRYRPCRDYCRFDRPCCMLAITAELAWPRVESWLAHDVGVHPV